MGPIIDKYFLVSSTINLIVNGNTRKDISVINVTSLTIINTPKERWNIIRSIAINIGKRNNHQNDLSHNEDIDIALHHCLLLFVAES